MIDWLIQEEWGKVGVRIWNKQAFVHCEISKWSPKLRKEALVYWEVFKNLMRYRGYSRLYSAVPAKDSKVNKWQGLFGQKQILDLGETIVYMQEI